MSSQGGQVKWGGREWFLVIMVAMMHGLNHAFYVMMAPLFVPMQAYFGFQTLSPVLAIGTAFLLPYGLSHVLFGALSDRVSKSAIMGFGALAASLLLAVAGMVKSYGAVLAAVAAAGVCAATYHGVSAAFLTILFPEAKGKGLGISGIGATLGLAVSPAVSGWICHLWGWQTSFVALGIFGAVFSVIFLLTVKEPGHAPSHADRTIGLRPVLLIMLPLLFFMALREFCGWGSFSLVPTFAQKIHGFAVDQAGRLSTCVTLAGLVAGPLFGMLSDRVDRKLVLLPLVIGSGVMIGLFPHLSADMLFPAALVFGFFYTATIPVLDAWIGDMAPDALKGVLFGIAVTAGIGFGSLAPVATAAVTDRFSGTLHGYQVAFLTLAAAIVISLIPMLMQRKRLQTTDYRLQTKDQKPG